MLKSEQTIKFTKKVKNLKLIIYFIILIKYNWNSNLNYKANTFFINLNNIKKKDDLYKILIFILLYTNIKR